MKLKGQWKQPEVERFLTDAQVPVRLAAITESGRPLLVSLWYAWRDGALWCASPMQADIVRALRRNGACAFEVSVETPPYFGVRGQGRVDILDGGKTQLRDLLKRYGGDPESELGTWLLGRDVEEATLRLTPDRMTSWDFSNRMADAFG
ncbi:MAG: hypothetical protein P1U65_19175 [Minwuia sp.]|nr:hypothetical protein [Minwuia sp.]